MATSKRDCSLFPGFPLTTADYDPLRAELAALGLDDRLVIAHSRGCLDALAEVPDGVPLVLLAPSHPERVRHGRRAQALVLTALARVPGVSDAVARRLRRQTFAAFGVPEPAGQPLPLTEAAARLETPPLSTAPRSHCWVVTSASDVRHEEQVQLAGLLTAQVVFVDGGHMFPITHPAETAAAIAHAVRLGRPGVDPLQDCQWG